MRFCGNLEFYLSKSLNAGFNLFCLMGPLKLGNLQFCSIHSVFVQVDQSTVLKNFEGPLTFHKGGWSTRFIHSATGLSRFLLHQADPKKTTEWGRDWRDKSDGELAGTRDVIPARDASCSFQTMWLDISLHGPPSGRLLSQTRKEEERRGCFSPTEPHKSGV